MMRINFVITTCTLYVIGYVVGRRVVAEYGLERSLVSVNSKSLGSICYFGYRQIWTESGGMNNIRRSDYV